VADGSQSRVDGEGFGAVPVVADHVLIRRIGAGAYGEVWLARNVTGVYRAVKVVWRARFEHERTYEREFTGLKHYEPISRLHPGLTDVLQVGRDDAAGYFYYVIELADPADEATGVGMDTYVPLTLGERVRRRVRLPVGECARIGAAVAEALGFLHEQGLVHRDVKPSNIIFVGGQPKLADIGLVAGLGDARSFVGTDGYIPPEGPGSPTADFFGLGKVLYEMVTGRNRLDFPDLPREVLDTPDAAAFAELNEIILRACAPEAAARHANASELRGELLLVDAGRSVRRLRRNARLAATWRRLGLVAAAVGLLGLIGVMFERKQAVEARERAASEARQRRAIEEKELVARQNLYAADMNLAQQALDSGNYGRAEELLAAYQTGSGSADLRGFEWHHLWHRVRGDSLGVMRGHDQVVSSLLLAPAGRTVFSGSFDGTIREWSIAEGRELRRWTLPGCAIMTMAMDSKGTRIAVEGGNRPMTALLDLASGTWTTNVGSASPSIQFAPGDRRLVRGAHMFLFETNGVTEVVDSGLRLERELPASGGRAWFSPDGRLLVTGSWGDVVKLWSWPALEPVGELADVGLVLSVAFSPDGTRMASGSRDGRLMLWDVASRRRLRSLTTHEGSIVWTVAFSPDGTRLASGGNDQAIRLWDGRTLEAESILRGHGSEVWSVLWLPDGKQLASAGKDQTVRFWNAVPRIPRFRFDDVIQAPAFSPDERRIALRRRDQGIHVLDLESGQTVQVFDAAELGGFSADGRSLSLLANDSTFERRSLEDGRLLGSLGVRTPTGKYTRRLLTADGRWLVVGHDDGGITAEAVGSDAAVRHLDGHRMMIVSLEVSPDGTRLLSGCLDRTARLWDLRSGELLHTFEGHRMAVASGAFSADGKVMATGSWDDTARVWDVESRRELALLGGHPAAVHDVALAPDRRTLAVLSGGGVLKFWSLAAGREAGVLRFDQGRGLGSLGFSPGGRWLAVVTASGGLTLLEAPRELARIVR
jgi:WD40 repeat protein